MSIKDDMLAEQQSSPTQVPPQPPRGPAPASSPETPTSPPSTSPSALPGNETPSDDETNVTAQLSELTAAVAELTETVLPSLTAQVSGLEEKMTTVSSDARRLAGKAALAAGGRTSESRSDHLTDLSERRVFAGEVAHETALAVAKQVRPGSAKGRSSGRKASSSMVETMKSICLVAAPVLLIAVVCLILALSVVADPAVGG